MNIIEKRKRIAFTIICTISALLIALISALPMYLHECEVMPVADRQRVFYKLGYLEYNGIDGVCGPKTHFAQRLYEHDWESVKEWKAGQE